MKNNTSNMKSTQEEPLRKGDNTNPVYWLSFAVGYIGVALWAIYSYFSGDSQYVTLGYVCAGLLPAGIVVNKLLKLFGCWSRPRMKKGARLGELLYAPALLIPAAIIGVPIYYFLHYPVLVCFLITSSALAFIVLVVDTCLNLFREEFTKFFVYLYKFLYKVVVEYFIVKFLIDFVILRIVWPVLEWMGKKIGKFLEKTMDLFIAFIDKVVVPTGRFIKKVAVWFYKNVMCPLGRAIKAICRFVVNHVVLPVARGIRAVVRFIRDVVVFIIKNIVVPMVKFYIKVCKAIKNYIIIPCLQFVARMFKAIKEDVIKPMVELTERVAEKMYMAFHRFMVKVAKAFWTYVLKPIGKAIKWTVKVIYKYLLKPLYRAVVEIVKFIFEYLIKPLYRLVVAILKAFYNYFLKYVFKVIEMQYLFIAKQLKTIFGWVFNDANGVVNYFITFPLIILSVVGSAVYFVWFH